MKKKNYISPNLIIMSINSHSLVLAGSGNIQSVYPYQGNGEQLGKYGDFVDEDYDDMEADW